MTTHSAQLAGWGRYPVADCQIARPAEAGAMTRLIGGGGTCVARGNGRSYGDASLNPDCTIDARRIDHLIDFDPAAGIVVCEAGLLLSDLIDVMRPRGWFPMVTPGTRLVTIGGMIASDVHGKNHHGAGSFCDHLQWLDLAIADGEVLRCSHQENADLFAATCGGMGLTGIILRACFQLQPIATTAIRQRTHHAPSLAEAMALFEASLDWTYSVAWIDCLAKGRNLGRSVVLLGEHATVDELPQPQRADPLASAVRRTKSVPIDFPDFAMGPLAVRMFNACYYRAQREGDAITGLDGYFYPLDTLHDWNRIYGKRGFVQFQCVLPLAQSEAGLTRMLTMLSDAGGASFLAVLKRLGKQSLGLLSFPMEGYTLALDFPANRQNLALVAQLHQLVSEYGGRVYLAKDACMTPQDFAGGYPMLTQMRQVRRNYGLDRRFSSLLSKRLEI